MRRTRGTRPSEQRIPGIRAVKNDVGVGYCAAFRGQADRRAAVRSESVGLARVAGGDMHTRYFRNAACMCSEFILSE